MWVPYCLIRHSDLEIKEKTLKKICFNTLLKKCIQFSRSVVSLCDPMNRSTPGLPVHHQLLQFTQTHVHWVSDAIQPSHPLSSPSPAPNPSQHQGLPMSQLFAWGGQSTGVSASASVLPMYTQDRSPLEWENNNNNNKTPNPHITANACWGTCLTEIINKQIIGLVRWYIFSISAVG